MEELFLPVPAGFDLVKAVCSHGLFMMAPNTWDPSTKTLQRPLRLSSSSSDPVTVRISHPSSLLVSVSVSGTPSSSLSPQDQQSVLAQVGRMLRLSEDNDRLIREFHELHPSAKAKGFGRLFRSPTLFEDMVKCILLCNCQWPRTLSMARALCELQLKLKFHSSDDDIHPKTPQLRETKRKRGNGKKAVIKLETRYGNIETDQSDVSSMTNSQSKTEQPQVDELSSRTLSCHFSNSVQSATDDSSLSSSKIGDFPTPEELAKLDPEFLAECCKLGYRAQRIVALAKSVVDHTLQLEMLERVSNGCMSSSYEEIDKHLSSINGFGPYTRANVLMCMGFYNRIPADTETVRLLKRFHHANKCTIKSVQEDVETVYGKYGSFQFLAYWSEMWEDYEGRFGKLSELPASSYGLFTASKMKDDAASKTKKSQGKKLI